MNEGGADSDTVEVNGGNGTERFEASTNGARTRFDRTTPAPFSLDIGSTEKLVVNANGGDDIVDAANLAAASVELTVDGGLGNDSITGGSGNDILLGGDGNSVLTGRRGNDVAFLGAGSDSFSWNPAKATMSWRARTVPIGSTSSAAGPTSGWRSPPTAAAPGLPAMSRTS